MTRATFRAWKCRHGVHRLDRKFACCRCRDCSQWVMPNAMLQRAHDQYLSGSMSKMSQGQTVWSTESDFPFSSVPPGAAS